jgi:chemotaxis regulatin CheY-phosphate phosphatase CheZ
MSDAQYAMSPSEAPPPSEADYDAIFAAVMETARGRWFLGEFAKRNRNADSEVVLAAIDRVEAVWRERGHSSPTERVRFDLLEMAKAIAQTKSEIAAIKPEGEAKGTLLEATEELGSIVRTTEQATSAILAAAERVQEIAWTLRERGTDNEACDALDQRATDIYSACSFQDLTGQRTRKVVEVMRFLEERINAMIEIWGDTESVSPAADMGHPPRIGDDGAEEHLDQPHIDEMMPAAGAYGQSAPLRNGHDVAGHDVAGDTDRPAEGPDTGSRIDDADVRAPEARAPEAYRAEAQDEQAAEAVTQEAGSQDAQAQESGSQDARTEDAVSPAQDAPLQDAAPREAAAEDAATHEAALPVTGADAAARDADAEHALALNADIPDAVARAVAERDSAATAGESPAAAEPGVAPVASAPEPAESAQEPEHEPLSAPALDELRNDPAALLSRILAIIHVPTEEASFGDPDAPEALPAEPTAVGSVVEALTSLDPGPPPGANAEIAATSGGESALMVAPPADEAEPAPTDTDPEPDFSPPPRPLSVADAVEEMLQRATARTGVPTRPGDAALAMMRAEPALTAEDAPKAAEAEKPAYTPPRPFDIDVPGLALAPDPVQTSPPQQSAPSERNVPLHAAFAPTHVAPMAPLAPTAGHALPEVALSGPETTWGEPFLPESSVPESSVPDLALVGPGPTAPLPEVALPAPDPNRPEPDAALPDIALRAPEAISPAPAHSETLPSAPVTPAQPPFVAFAEMAPVAEPPSAKTAPLPATPLMPAASIVRPMKSPAAPRNDVLAAIAALSEEEKIALFS